ncbi:MAG: hypothetical protein H2184_16650 [Candidatus Galacturonibacter soehngenii]|nr:hypothetical protein [Candidatus Galacturonibacter soehngenii]
MKFKCPGCGNYTLDEEAPGTYEICEICNWEDDDTQFYAHDYKGGANEMSLRQAQENFKKYKAQ